MLHVTATLLSTASLSCLYKRICAPRMFCLVLCSVWFVVLFLIPLILLLRHPPSTSLKCTHTQDYTKRSWKLCHITIRLEQERSASTKAGSRVRHIYPPLRAHTSDRFSYTVEEGQKAKEKWCWMCEIRNTLYTTIIPVSYTPTTDRSYAPSR